MQKMLKSKTIILFLVICLINVTISGCGALTPQTKIYYDRNDPYKNIKNSADNDGFIRIIYEDENGSVIKQKGYLSPSKNESIVILTVWNDGRVSPEKVEIPYTKIINVYNIPDLRDSPAIKFVGGCLVGTGATFLLFLLLIHSDS